MTGASGFIGGHLVRALAARGCRVSCVVRPTSAVDEIRVAGAQLIEGDITDGAGVARAIAASGARFVFHLAGQVRALAQDEFMRANAGGVESITQACADQPDPPALVLVSSLAASGPSRQRPCVESDLAVPVSDYGSSKLAGEHAAMRHAHASPITIVRPGVVFGAADRGMHQVFKPIARSGLHVVGGAGDHRVSLIAVADLVACLVLAAEQGERLAPGVPGHGIYFAAAEDLSHVELGMAIARALGQPPPRVLRLPRWSLRTIGRCADAMSRIRRRPGWVGSDKVREMLAGSWTCSADKARRQLGWSPAAPLAERLRETAGWYRDAGWV